MKVVSEFVDIPAAVRPMRAMLARPAGAARTPGILLYSDIFQLTPSTQRMVARFAGYGFTVLAPEIYHRSLAPGTAWAFDDAGREAGQAAAKATSTAAFDEDAETALAHLATVVDAPGRALGVVGFCLGGHLAFRAALSERTAATVCYYPTGLQSGALGSDPDNGSLGRAAEIEGSLMCVFGTADPHVPADAREMIEARLRASVKRLEIAHFDAEHAFMRDEGPRYDPVATDAGFARAISLFTGTLARSSEEA